MMQRLVRVRRHGLRSFTTTAAARHFTASPPAASTLLLLLLLVLLRGRRPCSTHCHGSTWIPRVGASMRRMKVVRASAKSFRLRCRRGRGGARWRGRRRHGGRRAQGCAKRVGACTARPRARKRSAGHPWRAARSRIGSEASRRQCTAAVSGGGRGGNAGTAVLPSGGEGLCWVKGFRLWRQLLGWQHCHGAVGCGVVVEVVVLVGLVWGVRAGIAASRALGGALAGLSLPAVVRETAPVGGPLHGRRGGCLWRWGLRRSVWMRARKWFSCGR